VPLTGRDGSSDGAAPCDDCADSKVPGSAAPELQGELAILPRAVRVALGRSSRRVRGVALLAAAPFALAACATKSSPLLFELPPSPSRLQASVGSEGASSPDGSTRAHGPRTAETHAGWAPAGPVTGDALHTVEEPRFEVAARDEAHGTGRDFIARCGRKDYAVTAANIVGYELLLNLHDRHVISSETYGSNPSSFVRNVSGSWTLDEDPFEMNQFLHPYGGTIYHGFARSAGFDYWESLGWDFAGSALWEVAGETDPPSINDQITTPFAGSFLGEALFRTASLVLERGGHRPSTAREVGAALISPSAALNRHAYGNRFKSVFPSRDPAVFGWWGVGARRNVALKDIGVLSNIDRNVAVAAFGIDYGLPGRPEYSYSRPFDYFHLEGTATSSENAIPENLMVRGLLVGTSYSSGPHYRGILGAYGCYDYFSPEVFTVSSTALSVGTTGQLIVSDKLALQGSLLTGVGFTAAGTAADRSADRSYRYSASPQALVALRAVYGDVAMLDLTVNDYLLSNSLESSGPSGRENIVRAQLSLIVRVSGRHAIGLQFVESSRHPSLSDLFDSQESVGALSLFYTFLGDTSFGVVRR
jgi:hypothetical protein